MDIFFAIQIVIKQNKYLSLHPEYLKRINYEKKNYYFNSYGGDSGIM